MQLQDSIFSSLIIPELDEFFSLAIRNTPVNVRLDVTISTFVLTCCHQRAECFQDGSCVFVENALPIMTEKCLNYQIWLTPFQHVCGTSSIWTGQTCVLTKQILKHNGQMMRSVVLS